MRRFGRSSTNQAATLSAMKAAKAGWIIMTVSVLSFHFCLSLEAVFYLRVLHSQNPVESFTAPYELFKVYRFGLRHCPTAFPDQSAPGRKSLKKIFATVISPALSSAFGFVILPVAKGLVGIRRIELLTLRLSVVCSTN